jgi:uncharacterized membrane protein YcaP (DUF421 family)
MPAASRPTRRSIDLDDDYAEQTREWRYQRLGIAGLIAIVGAAAAGAFGSPVVILRVGVVYSFLLLVFRIAGKRTLAQMTSFDLIVLLVIGDATQQGLIGDDYSVWTAIVAVSCLILMDLGLGALKHRSPRVERFVDGIPLILLARGELLRDRMHREGVDEDDILTSAREQHGIGRLDEIEYAVLERNGRLSIIPKARPPE